VAPTTEEDARSETAAPRPRPRRHRRTRMTRRPAAAPAESTTADGEEPPTGIELPTRFQKGEPGARPGIELAELAALPRWEKPAPVTCIDYGPERVETHKVENLADFVESRRPDWVKVRWINVDGHDPAVIRALAIKYGLHPLAIEDLFNTQQRPKFETFEKGADRHARILIIVRMVQLVGDRLEGEQISIFVGHNTVLTFQEAPGDIWDPIRNRIAKPAARIRELDASYLLYTLIDAIVDHCFPVLEHYGDRLEDLEDQVIDHPDRKTIQEIHQLKRDLLLLRRAVWPVREVINGLMREPHECISDFTRTYLRDVYDHAIQIMDIIETYREVASSLVENYMTSMSNRLSEVMKVLTIIGTIFIPLTFLAGVYGMNMPIPENSQTWAYPAFWGICVAAAAGMIAWFRKRGWI
jgi:magnesium transporter